MNDNLKIFGNLHRTQRNSTSFDKLLSGLDFIYKHGNQTHNHRVYRKVLPIYTIMT